MLHSQEFIGESLRGNRIGAAGLRDSERKSASERVSERVSEREGFQRFLRGFERFLEVFRGFERFSEVLRGFQSFLRGFQRFLRGFQRSSQRPSQRQISSQRLSVLLPLIVLPLELSPNLRDTVAPVLPPPCHSEHFNCQRCRASISKRKWTTRGGVAATLSRVALHRATKRRRSDVQTLGPPLPESRGERILFRPLSCPKWGCDKWGFRGRLAALLGNRPKSAFFCFSGGSGEHLENPGNGGKGPFSSDILRFA